MKALSLTQPYASAVACGIKQWETRSWPTSFRGEVCIHASKGFPKWARVLNTHVLSDLPLGCIVCVCNLAECLPTKTVAKEISELEAKWSDFDPGSEYFPRYAYRLENVRVLNEPVYTTDNLGFWGEGFFKTVATEIEQQVIRQLRGRHSLLDSQLL